MNNSSHSSDVSHQNDKFRLLHDISKLIGTSLSSKNPQTILALKHSLEKFLKNGVFIIPDNVTYLDGAKKMQQLEDLRNGNRSLSTEHNDNKNPSPLVSLTSNGRKDGKAHFSEAVSDIYGVYVTALVETLNSLPLSKGLVDVNTLDQISLSFKNFSNYIESIQYSGLPISGRPQSLVYPYNIGDFSGIEPIVRLLPGQENFGLKYLPKELGIQLIDTQIPVVTKSIPSQVSAIIKIEKPDRKQLFEGMTTTQKELISSYLELSNTILHSLESRKIFRTNISDEKVLQDSLKKYKNFMELIPFDGEDSVVVGLITLMENFIDIFEAKLIQIPSDSFDDSAKVLFFTECLREFNTTLFRGILLNSTTYKHFIDTKGEYFSENIKQLISQKFDKLFPNIGNPTKSNVIQF